MILYGVIVILTLAFLPDGIVSLFGKKPGEIRKMLAGQWDMLSDKTARKKRRKVRAARTANR